MSDYARTPRHLADLVRTLALELAMTDVDKDGSWIVSRHEALMAIAASSGGSVGNLVAAEAALDPKVDVVALGLLVAARPYAAFWDC